MPMCRGATGARLLYKVLFFGLSIAHTFAADTSRQMEYLERGVVAIRQSDDSVFLSWRWLGNEPDNVAYNVYRSSNGQTERLNSEPIADRTNFSAPAGPSDPQDTYYVRAIVNGEEQEPSLESHV